MTPPLNYCPLTGNQRPVFSQAHAYRQAMRTAQWLFNPWTGADRNPKDVKADPLGLLIDPPRAVILPDEGAQ